MNDRWTARVRADGPAARVHLANASFRVGGAVRFTSEAADPSAVEVLLGAIGADLFSVFREELRRRHIEADDLELRISAGLVAPLAQLGVVGETGDPGLSSIEGTLFVTADADRAALDAAWSAALARSPVAATLARGSEIRVEVRPML